MTLTNTDRAQTCNALLKLMDALESELAVLADKLRQSGRKGARVFELPQVEPQQDEYPEGPIAVSEWNQAAAFEKAVSALSQFYVQPNASSKLVYRLPGVVYVTGNQGDDIAGRVTHINTLKERFSALVGQLGDRDDKFEWVHRTFPGLITLQVVRKIHCLRGMRTVSFSWAHRDAIYKKTKAEVLEMLERSSNRSRPQTDGEPWHFMVDQAIAKVGSLPDNVELRQRRPGRVHPVINLRTDEVPAQRIQRPAALPAIILEPSERIKVGTLADYVPPAGGSASIPARRRTKEEPLIDFLGIYEVR